MRKNIHLIIKMILFKIIYTSLFLFLTRGDFDFETGQDDNKPEDIGTMQLFEQPSFVMGTSNRTYESRGEYPKRWEYTRPFRIDRYPVTVADFLNFVKEDSYFTTQPDLNKHSFVFFKHLRMDIMRYEKKFDVREPWFIPVVGARWDKPYGVFLNVSSIKYNPVTHVGFADAHSYCKHLDKRLPTEYEWELAARANNRSWNYPWGDRMRRNRMNIWQGIFPIHDHGYDGHTHVSPVNAYPPQNDLGMYDMLGNVWEWTTTEYMGTDLPQGEDRSKWVTLKGGSFLDTLTGSSGTSSVRNSMKIGRHYKYTAENVGFRCAVHVRPKKREKKRGIIRYEDTRQYVDNVANLAKKFIVLKEKMNRTFVENPNTTPEHLHSFDMKDEL